MPPVASFLISWYLPNWALAIGRKRAAKSRAVGYKSTMFPSAYLLVLLAQPWGAAPHDALKLNQGSATLDFEWSDAEDRIQGSISPKRPVEGQPIDVSAHVGTFQGAEFDGPVTLSLKEAGSKGGGQTQTVKRAQGEKAWRARFTPVGAGAHTFEVSFATTRHKVAAGTIEVHEAALSRWPWCTPPRAISGGADSW